MRDVDEETVIVYDCRGAAGGNFGRSNQTGGNWGTASDDHPVDRENGTVNENQPAREKEKGSGSGTAGDHPSSWNEKISVNDHTQCSVTSGEVHGHPPRVEVEIAMPLQFQIPTSSVQLH